MNEMSKKMEKRFFMYKICTKWLVTMRYFSQFHISPVREQIITFIDCFFFFFVQEQKDFLFFYFKSSFFFFCLFLFKAKQNRKKNYSFL